MSAYEVTDTLVNKINEDIYDAIILNFANCDMVGHTGVFDAAVKAVEAVDACVGRLVDLVSPSAQLLDENLGIGIGSHSAQSKAVDTGCSLSILDIISGNIADIVVADLQGLQTGSDTGQITGLISTAEVVVEVGGVALIAGSVGEDHFGVLGGSLLHGIDVAEGDTEDDVCAK